MDLSLGGWWLGGCVHGCVGRWVDVCMDVSVGGWWLGGYMDGCVGRWLVVGWIHGWMCL